MVSAEMETEAEAVEFGLLVKLSSSASEDIYAVL